MLVFVLLTAWMVGSPGYRHFVNHDAEYIRWWMMFYGFGRDVCDVQYRLVTPEKPRGKILDRYAVLGTTRSEASRPIVHIRNQQAAINLGKRLCRSLEETTVSPDVRMRGRCGHYKGWRRFARGRKNLCAPETK